MRLLSIFVCMLFLLCCTRSKKLEPVNRKPFSNLVISNGSIDLSMDASGNVKIGQRLVVQDSVFTNTMFHIINTMFQSKWPNTIPNDSTEYFRHKAEMFDELKKRYEELQVKSGMIDYEYTNLPKIKDL